MLIVSNIQEVEKTTNENLLLFGDEDEIMQFFTITFISFRVSFQDFQCLFLLYFLAMHLNFLNFFLIF